MSLYHNSKLKLRNLQRTIDALLDGDFPLESGRGALKRLKSVFFDLELKIDRASKINDEDALKTYAQSINVKFIETLPILGFILRSTNVRNAFELLDPFQVLAQKLLQGKPQILLSSEWDYVPFAYPQSVDDLKSFVLIGMPASEAASALLTPLAGHELGHAVWRNRLLGSTIHASIQKRCVELYFEDDLKAFKEQFPKYNEESWIDREILPEAIAQSVEIALFQAEEIFCDLFAYGLFGESYLYAFAYILAPGSGSRPRRSKYPTHQARLKILERIAAQEHATIVDVSSLKFADQRLTVEGEEYFIIQIAEKSVGEVINDLWMRVRSLLSEGNICRPNSEKSEQHLREFRMGIPSFAPVCLGDIINAGWAYYKELQKSTATQSVDPSRPRPLGEKVDQLNELVLKTIEVLEFKRRTQ